MDFYPALEHVRIEKPAGLFRDEFVDHKILYRSMFKLPATRIAFLQALTQNGLDQCTIIASSKILTFIKFFWLGDKVVLFLGTVVME